MGELLWYIPNTTEAGVRGDDVAAGWADLGRSVTLAKVGGGGAASTWLVGSYDEVAAALRGYVGLGITHVILSDTPCLRECARIGDELLPRLRATFG